MQLGPIVLKLRLAETRFGEYIFGAAELALALEYTLQKEAAFVVQLSETVNSNSYDSGINQKINERFAVIVALDNATSDKDKLGFAAYDVLAEVRTEIFRAILGWQMTGAESLISYGGGKIAGINRARLWYQFEFVVDTRISDEDGVDSVQDATDDDNLGWFDTLYAQYILAPSERLDAIGENLPITAVDIDMTQVIDFTSNPDVDGPFGKGFGIKFDVYKP